MANSIEPVIPLPNPGEGGPVDGGPGPVIPLPNPGEGGPVGGGPGPVRPQYAAVRFLHAAFGYGPFRIQVGSVRMAGYLAYGTVSDYRRVPPGYRLVTVSGADGYIYLQKTLPFRAGAVSTVAVINTAGGLDLLEIPDACCPPGGGFSNFRVSNLAYNSRPLDVLLGDGRVVYADVRFKETTAYKRIRPGEYEFLFAETNLSPLPPWMDIETLDSAFLGMYPSSGTVATVYLDVAGSASYTIYLLSGGDAPDAVQALSVMDHSF